MGYKHYKFCENRARDTPLRGVCIPHFNQISVKKFQFWGSYTLIVALMGVKFGTEEGPLWGEKPQNQPLRNLNKWCFALCAMLPVKEIIQS